uniref:Thiamine-phosphate synthase n=1 Tax=Fervidobacterium thailandense TaxID=1008305 RepID=A0A7C5VMR0_9BACT
MVMVLAGFDPSAGAGILQDIKSLALLGITASGVVTTYTVQNTQRVFSVTFRRWEEIDRELSVLERPKFIKIGLITPEFVRLVREKYPDAVIVWNVILSSSSGHFFESEAEVLKNVKYADFVVLNNEEAEKLGLRPNEKCVVTCGHREGKNIKVLYKDLEFSIPRVFGAHGTKFHGTGCAFSSLFTGFLSIGYKPEEALKAAMEVIKKILELSEIAQVQTEKLAREWFAIEAIRKLEEIMPELERIGVHTVPEVGQNVSFALPWSKSEEEVAKFPGRIRLKEGKPVFVSGPSFKDKSHTARMAITAKEFSPHIRCVSNVRYEKSYVENAIRAGLKVFKYERSKEPPEVSKVDGQSMQWMIRTAYEIFGEIPDVIYDEGWFGKEAMIRVFGTDPEDVIKKMKIIVGFNLQKLTDEDYRCKIESVSY